MISRASLSRWSPFAILAFVSALLSAPMIFLGASPFSDDALDHARWYENFSTQLWAGEIYPRWLAGMNFGLGSPAFYYYPPLPYYLTSLLRPLFSNDPGGWDQLGVGSVIALLLSGVTAFIWLRKLANERAALIGSILYIAAPYHLASDLYVRFAYAELWSFVWMPLILYFVHRVSEGDKRAILGVTTGYALLILTHLPTTMLFSPFVLAYAAVLPDARRLVNLGRVTLGMVLGAGIAGIYLYPALTMGRYVFLDRMSTGYFSYANWLLPSSFYLWTQDKITIALLALDLGLIVLAAFVLTQDGAKRIRVFWFIAGAASVVMMTDLGRPIWWLLYPLDRVQFPFRFGTILTLAVTALVTLAISVSTRGPRTRPALLYAAILLIATWVPGTIWAASTVWQGSSPGSAALLDTPDTPEYRPRWNEFMSSIDWQSSIDEDYWDRRMNADFTGDLKATGLTRNDPTQVRFDRGDGSVEVLKWQPREIDLSVNANSDAVIDVGQFYFPNWIANMDDHVQSVSPQAPHGLIAIAVPSGYHKVSLTLAASPEESLGAIISMLSVLAFIAAGVALWRR